MRKNTLIKLLAVLAMCFLIGAALVSCGEGKTEDATKTIVGVQFVGNDLVITYDDGTKVPTAIPEAEVCQHKSVAKQTLSEHTEEANGVYLEVCNECGYAWVKYEQRHTFGEEIVIDPTCTDEGYTFKICTTCGYYEEYDETATISHLWDDGIVVVEDGKNLCVDGATKIYSCEFGCGETKSETVAPVTSEGIDKQHNVATWDFTTNAPTLNAPGVATGVCQNCGETVTYDLDAFIDGETYSDKYTVNVTPRTNCSQALVATFTCKEYVAFTYADVEVEAAGGSHMLYSSVEKKLVDVLAAGKIDPKTGKLATYSTEEFAGIKAFADKPIDSCTPILAYYYCEVEGCNALAVDVYAYSEHAWESTGKDNVVCGVEAFEHFECPDCGETKDVSLGTRQHDYDYIAFSNVSGDALNAFTYTVDCKHDGCPLADVKSLTDADVTIDRVTKPVTCEKNGEIYISYTVPGTETTLTYTHTVIKKGHILNGQQMNAVVNTDAPVAGVDTIYAWTEGCGIVPFDGKPFSATQPVIGHFECTSGTGERHEVDVWVQIGVGVPVVPVTPAH